MIKSPPIQAVKRPVLSTILLGFIRFYQLTLSPFFGNQCRFTPSCSHYAQEAICQHGPGRGLLLTTGRILRCNPFCEGGHDPVPETNHN